jgi:hypothetical protein
LRSYASGRDSQGRSSAFTEGPSQMETVTRRAAQQKQKSEPAAGRRIGPEAVTEHVRNGTGRHASRTTLFPLLGDAIPRQTRSPLLAPDLWTKSRISHPALLIFHSAWSRSSAHRKGEIPFASPCPRRLCIAAPPIRIPSALQSIAPALEFTPPPWRTPGRFPPSRRTGPHGCIHSR